MRLRERILVFLGVCFPVPLFAATGLSVPLPGTVARMVVELVPFADVATLAEEPNHTRGAIVLTQAERRRLVLVVPSPSPPVEVEALASVRRLEAHRKEAPGRRRPLVPEPKESGSAQTKPPAQRAPGLPPAPTPVAPVEDAPAPGTEKPKPAVPPRPKPKPAVQPQPRPKPKPKPKKPETKPKPEPDPTEPKPKPEPRPQPEPKPSPVPERAPAEGRDTVENDRSARAGRPSNAAPSASSADGR